jgi:peroxiredoxin family protein
MADILESLFDSKERARLIRFFIQNPQGFFSFSEIVKKNMLKSAKTRSELLKLIKMKCVIKRTKNKKNFYQLNPKFNFYPELRNLVIKANTYPQCQSLAKFAKIGNMKLVAVSGVFINYPKSKADIILVGDAVSKAKLRNVIASLEAEIGKEVTFMLMTMDDFKYRLNMLDKFVLEFLEGPHEEIINKITGLKQFIAKRKL